MKKRSIPEMTIVGAVAFLLALGAVAYAALLPPSPQTIKLAWDWSPDPALMGGLPTNQYETNIVFRLYEKPSLGGNGSWMLCVDDIAGSNRTASVLCTNSVMFFELRTVSLSSGQESLPSNSALWVWQPEAPQLRILPPKP
jgi:hypothetical protein